MELCKSEDSTSILPNERESSKKRYDSMGGCGGVATENLLINSEAASRSMMLVLRDASPDSSNSPETSKGEVLRVEVDPLQSRGASEEEAEDAEDVGECTSSGCSTQFPNSGKDWCC